MLSGTQNPFSWMKGDGSRNNLCVILRPMFESLSQTNYILIECSAQSKRSCWTMLDSLESLHFIFNVNISVVSHREIGETGKD